MSSKNSLILTENPYKNLSRTEITLLFALRSIKKGPKSFCLSNSELASIINKTLFTASRAIKKLEREGFVQLKYTPDGKGLIRTIEVLRK